jgi:hypothetical protein
LADAITTGTLLGTEGVPEALFLDGKNFGREEKNTMRHPIRTTLPSGSRQVRLVNAAWEAQEKDKLHSSSSQPFDNFARLGFASYQ